MAMVEIGERFQPWVMLPGVVALLNRQSLSSSRSFARLTERPQPGGPPAVKKLLLIDALLPPYQKATVTSAYEYWAAGLNSTSIKVGPKTGSISSGLSLIHQPVTKSHGYCRYE